jgi:integrase
MAVLEELVAQARDPGTAYLITWHHRFKDHERSAEEPWRPIVSPKRAWATAMKTIELAFGRRWHFHDLRATYITQIVITAGPIADQRLAHRSDNKTTQGYVEVAEEVLRATAEQAGPRASLKVVNGGNE